MQLGPQARPAPSLDLQALVFILVVFAAFQLAAAIYLLIHSSMYIGNVNIAKLKKRSNYVSDDPGLDVNISFYWGYFLAYPLIVFEFTETLDMVGIRYYAAGTFFALIFYFATEYVRGISHWILFGLALTIWGLIFIRLLQAVVPLLNTLQRYHVSRRLAFWLRCTTVTFLVGWCLFPVTWLIRNDIDSTHGWVHPTIMVPVLGFLDVCIFPVFALFLAQFRALTEDIHLLEIIKALRWVKLSKDGREVPDPGQREGPSLPPEVLLRTIPALLEYSLSHHPSDIVHSLKTAVRDQKTTQLTQKRATRVDGIRLGADSRRETLSFQKQNSTGGLSDVVLSPVSRHTMATGTGGKGGNVESAAGLIRLATRSGAESRRALQFLIQNAEREKAQKGAGAEDKEAEASDVGGGDGLPVG
uniref:Uncharacterized protein n=1 Tax=Chromera velia CCMP2878 TaxID=1169474 RepID=A0A0G4HHL1_9ALVE|eukprot:Cvel_27701.t1-p1 / transcript=Cvel_27701.t1 / gene=Cvel_27701 / organism=Chromera_velia_CCMP2878 / gene_product=hypothetical protein / transcript_product=hypothetical protein / location=Cvel_scaffold3499:6613-12932(+) / protein_length=414 / sequence_SO=supercontig / SO=protein_coding / is_pseudo=false